jgi:hypothetical protein
MERTLALVVSLAHKRDEGVSGVRNDGANDTSQVTRGEGNSELSVLGVSALGLSENVGVEQLHNLLEEVELGLRDEVVIEIKPEA